jgi:hypothetical protein
VLVGAGPVLADKVLASRVLDSAMSPSAVLASAVLADPVLAGTVLADPVLADAVLVDTVLADTGSGMLVRPAFTRARRAELLAGRCTLCRGTRSLRWRGIKGVISACDLRG